MSDELLFSLKGARSLEPFAGMRAEVITALRPSAAIAEAVASMLADVARAGEAVRGAIAHDLGAFALAAETIRERGDEWRAAFEHVGHLNLTGALADGYGRAAAQAIAASAFTLSEPPPPEPLRIIVHVYHHNAETDTAADFVRAPAAREWES